MTTVHDTVFDQERALYHLQNAAVEHCTFAGPADGESALKEAGDIAVRDCLFSLRYPLWHTRRFTVERTVTEPTCRAALWYAEDGVLTDCTLNGVKCLRECERMTLRRCTVRSPEFGWRCRGLTLEDCRIEAEYFLMGTVGGTVDALTLNGKYSFQYTDGLTVTNSRLMTKDAFWHAHHVTVRDSEVSGEYLGWYSDGLTLIRCHIRGTQPLCYCKNLTLIDCTMEDTDLSFEYSDVNATVSGNILSVKNPHTGRIVADTIGEIIREDSVMENDCVIEVRL